jgi:Putative type VII ESX secretion system translocon, EccE
MSRPERRYVFGSVAEGISLMGLRPGQVVVLATGLLVAVLVLYVGPSGIGALLAIAASLAAVAISFLPVRGRTLERWAPVAARWLLSADAARAYSSAAPTAGARAVLRAEEHVRAPSALPAALADLDLLAAPVRGGEVGVVRDRRRDTYVGALAARVGSFGLLDTAEQERRLAAWGTVLASFASEGSPVRRLQWVERTVPADGDAPAAYLQAERDPAVPLTSRTVASYIELIEGAADVTREHEILIALQVDARRGWRAVRRAGGGDLGACEVLKAELRSLADRLELCDVEVSGALRPRSLAAAIRHPFDPYGGRARERLARLDPAREADDPALAGPVAAETSWRRYRTDSALHASYWICGWPRIEVGPAFLAPLLMRADALRTVAVTMEPISPRVAIRRAEHAVTKQEAEREAKERRGFRTTARARQREGAAAQREEELAAGHAEVRFAGFVTVSARKERALERNLADVEHAAEQARLELEPRYGEQEAGFTFTLPLCRGLR